jgi:ATP-dependent RNA helicase RhlE
VKTYGKHVPLRSFVVYGGVNINPQIEELRKGVEILVATPGRLLDLVGQKAVNLGKVQILVLDEADRMLDMGFIPDIKRIIALLPKPPMRQTLLFSATFSDEIRRLSGQFLDDPATVEVARRNTPAELVTQYAYHVEATRKRELLAHLVKKNDWAQVLVFCKTKHGANRLASQLQKDRINADAIHGNKSQNARIRALEDFKEGKVKVLVATDIAARGLDIEDLPHVVNFDLPHVPEDYVHRIGRTGRAGATGEALSLVSHEDRPLLGAVERLINKKIEVRQADGFEPERRGHGEAPAERERAQPSGEGRSQRGSQGHRGGEARADGRKPNGDGRKSNAEGRKPNAEGRNANADGRNANADGRKPNGDGRKPNGDGRKPLDEGRAPRGGRGRKRDEDRAPRYAGSPAQRTSGNSGGMDFSKPYVATEPSTPAAPAPERPASRKPAQAIPALFRRKTD